MGTLNLPWRIEEVNDKPHIIDNQSQPICFLSEQLLLRGRRHSWRVARYITFMVNRGLKGEAPFDPQEERLTEEEKSFLALAIYNLRRQQRPLWKTFTLEASLTRKLDIRGRLWGLNNPQGQSNE